MVSSNKRRRGLVRIIEVESSLKVVSYQAYNFRFLRNIGLPLVDQQLAQFDINKGLTSPQNALVCL